MATKQDILNLNIHKLTQDQYDEAFAAGQIDPNAIYLTPEEVIDLSGYLTKINAANIYLTKEEMETIKSQVTSAFNSKQATITGAATTITNSNLTANRALISDSNGKVGISAVTSTELGYLDGVTSNIQTQLGGKEPTITTLPVSKGGTGAKSFTSGQALIGNGTGAISTRAITNNTASSSIKYISATSNLITANTLAYWDGAYSSAGSSRITKVGTIDKGTWNATPIAIEYGGTGATTAAAARTNLETAYCQIKTAKTSATKGWYRIAQTDSGVKNNIGTFEIQSATTSTNNAYNSTTLLVAGITYIRGAHIEQLSHHENIGDINKARIVYKSTASSSNRAYLEIYGTRDVVRTITVKLVEGFGWSLIDPNTPGEIPSGYQSSGDNGEGLTLIAGALQAEGLVGDYVTAAWGIDTSSDAYNYLGGWTQFGNSPDVDYVESYAPITLYDTLNVSGAVTLDTQLAVSSGGTGVKSFASGQALIGNGTGAISTKAITDNTSAKAMSSTSTNLVSERSVSYAIAHLVDSAPETLNTLNELAAALGDDPNFATTVATEIGKKENAFSVLSIAKGGTGASAFTQNRPLFYNGTYLTSSSHYIEGQKLGVNTIYAPNEPFFVNGQVHFASGHANGCTTGTIHLPTYYRGSASTYLTLDLGKRDLSRMIMIEVKGNGYNGGYPIHSMYQFYNYYNNGTWTILADKARCYGDPTGPLKIYYQEIENSDGSTETRVMACLCPTLDSAGNIASNPSQTLNISIQYSVSHLDKATMTAGTVDPSQDESITVLKIITPVDAVPISNGGTGATSFTNNKLLFSNGSALVSSNHSVDSTRMTINGALREGISLYINGNIALPVTARAYNATTKEASSAAISFSNTLSAGSYHPMIGVKTNGGHNVHYAGLKDNIGFYGFIASNTTNRPDWTFLLDAATGNLTTTSDIKTSQNLTTSKLHVTNYTDADLTDSEAAFIIGPKDGEHIEIDSNEIMVKTNATTAGTLYLQNQGGAVSINAITKITDTTDSTATTNGALVVTGGVGIGKTLRVAGNTVLAGTLDVGSIITLNNSDPTKQKIKTAAGAMYISSALTLYLDSGSAASLIFRPQGTEQARFNISGKLELISGGKAAATITGPDTAGTFYFPNTGGTIVTHATRGTAVGSASVPVYIASTGRATQCTASSLFSAFTSPSSNNVLSLTIAGQTRSISRLIRPGITSGWIYARDKSLIQQSSLDGYSPFASIKTKNGDWAIGAYDNESYTDELIFSYVTDADYTAKSNKTTTQIKFNQSGVQAPVIWGSSYLRSSNYGSAEPGTTTPGYGTVGAIYFKII